jgi:hypothetical protein
MAGRFKIDTDKEPADIPKACSTLNYDGEQIAQVNQSNAKQANQSGNSTKPTSTLYST